MLCCWAPPCSTASLLTNSANSRFCSRVSIANSFALVSVSNILLASCYKQLTSFTNLMEVKRPKIHKFFMARLENKKGDRRITLFVVLATQIRL